jgi:LPXTG-site transpeptidase (sortase) family protein
MLKKSIKILIIILNAAAGLIVLYLFSAPFLPELSYRLRGPQIAEEPHSIDQGAVGNPEGVTPEKSSSTTDAKSAPGGKLPEAGYSVSKNRLIIKSIGVNAPIVEAKGEWGLDRGAWRMPESSTPDKGGNTVISGHRFKYLPPNNTTFYLFHKLKNGESIKVVWIGKEYEYRISEIKKVKKTDVSILDQTMYPVLTLFTCDPIYSQENRLVVIAKPVAP